MYVVTVTFALNTGCEALFLERVREQARDSLGREPNCHQFDVCTDPERPDQVFLYEVYGNPAAFQSHLESEHFKDFDAAVAGWVADKTVTTWIRDEPESP